MDRTELSDLVLQVGFPAFTTLISAGFGWLAYQNGNEVLREVGELAKQPDMPLFTLAKTGALMTTTGITAIAAAGYATLTGLFVKGAYEDLRKPETH